MAALFGALLAQFLLGKRVPASWRAWVWRIALLQSAFALLPLAPIRWEILAPPAAATPTAISAPLAKSDEFPVADNLDLPPLESSAAALIESAPSVPNAAPIENAPTVSIAQAQAAPLDWRAVLLAIYALGIAFQCAQLMRGKRQLRRILRACAPSQDAVLTARLNALTTRLSLKSAPQLLICEGGSPFLTGVWRPQIVLPRALCAAELSQLDAILAHELAHAKRRDLIWLGATWLLQTLLWFHPLSWAARRFHGLETECACDEMALQLAPIAPQSYGALLLNSMNNSKFSSPLAAGTCDTLFALKTRLLRLNNAPRTPRKTAKFAFAAALLLSCGALVPLKLVARAQEAPADSPDEDKNWPAGRITEPQYHARAVVQGIVISKATQKPLVGVPIFLLAPRYAKKTDNTSMMRYQQAHTDARGYFRFNTIGAGKHTLAVAASLVGTGKNTGFSAEHIYEFNLKNGRKRDFVTAISEDYARRDRMKTMGTSSEINGTGTAVVQGVVLSSQTQKPLAGVPMILTYGKSSQQSVTDARGYFRFNARAGRHSLGYGNNSPVQTFDLKNGQNRDFAFSLNELSARDVADVATTPSASKNAGSAVVQGVVFSKRTRDTLVGVPIILLAGNTKMMPKQQALAELSNPQKAVTDKRGYFRFNAKGGVHSLLINGRISVDKSKISDFSAQQIHVLPLKDATMRNFGFPLEEMRQNSKAATSPANNKNWESVSGQIVDENKRPLAGVNVEVLQIIDGFAQLIGATKSDVNGRFRLAGLRDGAEIIVGANLKGYGIATSNITKNGSNTNFEMTMPRASAILRGVVIGEDGQPARNFRVEPFGYAPSTRTDAQGLFFFPQIAPGATDVRVFTPNGGNGWGPIKVRGGDQNAKIRLTRSISDARFPRPVPVPATSVNSSAKTRALIGKMAPEIQASYWANGKVASLVSLRGKVVLLAFQNFNSYKAGDLNDFARSFAATARVVGVQFNAGGITSMRQSSFDAMAQKFPFPIALEASIADVNPAGGATFSAYGFTKAGGYAVIGRDGKIIYAGDDLQNAIRFASR